ncbi:MAG: hypothetical protein QOC72_2776 [Methylobacteriaceae bacterium]|nr:hypothetical protein [Methylobacteriaceae bacterium]
MTLLLSTCQQEATLIVANRQKLAETLSEVGKVRADSRLAYTQLSLMALPNGAKVPAKDLKDAITKLDVAIDSFGAKLGPFEEFVRRTNYYGVIKPHDASPLQKAWDKCFVLPYWGDDKNPGYLKLIEENLTKCDESTCPKLVAQELKQIHDQFYQGYCRGLTERSGEPVKKLELIWFNRELRRISVQAPRRPKDPYYRVGVD